MSWNHEEVGRGALEAKGYQTQRFEARRNLRPLQIRKKSGLTNNKQTDRMQNW